MALVHAQPAEILDIRPLHDEIETTKTHALIKTDQVEVIRMVLHAGKVLADHKAPGDITVQGLEGRIEFTAMGKTRELERGDMLFLPAGETHSVRAVNDSSFLLTIVLPQK